MNQNAMTSPTEFERPAALEHEHAMDASSRTVGLFFVVVFSLATIIMACVVFTAYSQDAITTAIFCSFLTILVFYAAILTVLDIIQSLAATHRNTIRDITWAQVQVQHRDQMELINRMQYMRN